MLYRDYESKILKLAKIKNTIYKFRFLIIAIISVIFAAVIALMATRGMVLNDLVLSRTQYEYGSPLGYSATFFMSQTGYEFCSIDGDEWEREVPTTVGKYKIRAFAKKTGGISYSAEKTFEITKTALSVEIEENSLTYGSKPTVKKALSLQDEFKEIEFNFDSIKVGERAVNADKSSIVILNKDGEDVTSCYEITCPVKEITITQKQIDLNVFGDEKEYDGTPLTSENYVISDLCYDDQLEITFNKSIIDVGSVENTPEYKITSGSDDVTYNYDVNLIVKDLIITSRKITLKPVEVIEIYDDNYHSPNDYEIVSGTLADGQFIDYVAYDGYLKNVGEEQSSIIYVNILSSVYGDVTHNYDCTFEQGKITVNKREVNVLSVKDKSYDTFTLTTNDFTYGQGYELVSGHNLTLETNGTFVGTYTGDKINYSVFTYDYSEDVTENYIINVDGVSFEILKIDLFVEVVDVVEEYSNVLLTSNDVLVTGLIADHYYLDVKTRGGIENVGTTTNEFISLVVKDGAGTDVTENYNIIHTDGTITITPCQIEIFALYEKVYDGKTVSSLSSSDVYVSIHRITKDSYGLFHRQSFTAEYEFDTTVKKAGTYALNITSFHIIDQDDGNVDGNFKVVDKNGEYIIDRRPITVSSASKNKEYDRTYLSSPNTFEIIEGTLAENQRCVTYTDAKILSVGTIDNAFSYVIYDEFDTPVTFNYAVSENWGKLTINPILMIVEFYDVEKFYDGISVGAVLSDKYWISKGKLLSGDKIVSVDASAVSTEYGAASFSDISANKYYISGSASVDYDDPFGNKDYYAIEVRGIVNVLKAQITVMSESVVIDSLAEKVDESVVKKWWISYGSLADGEWLDVEVEGEIPSSGSAPNKIISINLNGIEGLNVIGDGVYEFNNYIITVKQGTITVK